MQKDIEEFECIVCGKKAIRRTKPKPGRRNGNRGLCRVGAVTCCNLCARHYRNNVESIKRKIHLKRISETFDYLVTKE